MMGFDSSVYASTHVHVLEAEQYATVCIHLCYKSVCFIIGRREYFFWYRIAICYALFYMTAIQDMFCVAVFLHRSVQNLVWNICLLTESANQIWRGKLFPGSVMSSVSLYIQFTATKNCKSSNLKLFRLIFLWPRWSVFRRKLVRCKRKIIVRLDWEFFFG